MRSYQYTFPEELESDFNRTVDVVTQISVELIARVEKCHLEQEPDFKLWGMLAEELSMKLSDYAHMILHDDFSFLCSPLGRTIYGKPKFG